MENNLSLEKEHLKQTKSDINTQITILNDFAEKKKEDIIDQKQQMREETKHSVSSNLWNSDAFSQLVELSQFATQVSDSISKYESYIKKIEQLEKSLQRPYFARIDFQLDNDNEIEEIYIGRYPVMDEENYAMIIYDWRSPISSMFYRFELGKAHYEAPMGNISGEISLKRQYEIQNGELKYYFDTNVQIIDDFLRKVLSENASPQMKSIVESIQREQDIIIRNKDCDLLMVQGVAGSGKTSVALHRVSYLMYEGLSNKLSNQDIIIISPNTLFEQYISNVLPELGEENITSFLMDELLETILKKPFQTRNQLYESLITNSDKSWIETFKENLRFKMNSEFIKILKDMDLPKNLSLDEITNAYIRLFNNMDHFKHLNSLEDLILFTKDNLNSNTLHYDDASALVYLYLKSNKFNDYIHIKQVVIDEAQDYYPIHFEILNLLFPRARFTILGDINQTIEKSENVSFYDEVKGILNKKKASLVSMNKSFRCAHEILQFSSKFTDMKINNFDRHCDEPKIYKCENDKDYTSLINEVKLCQEKGYESIGILCKSEKESIKLFESLKNTIKINLISTQLDFNLTGICILPIYLSKGLEFDAALIWGVNNIQYHTLEDRQLLYIACTRALHRLNLFYSDNISPLLE